MPQLVHSSFVAMSLLPAALLAVARWRHLQRRFCDVLNIICYYFAMMLIFMLAYICSK